MKRPPAGLLAVGLVAVLALGLSACGGSGTPGVASLSGGSTTSTTSTTGSSGSGTAGSGTAQGTRQKDALEFSTCMRKHGVKNFPDPKFTGGGVELNVGGALDPTSPTFQAAQKACRSLLPKPSAAQVHQAQQQALEFSKCMRQHGVTNFPDPKFTGGGIRIGLHAGSGLDPTSPTFKAAQQACSKYMHLPNGKGSGPQKIGSGSG